MATVAQVNVKVGADTEGLKRGVQSAKREMGYLADEAKRSNGKIREALGIAAIAGIAAVSIKQITTEIYRMSLSASDIEKTDRAFQQLKRTLADGIAPVTRGLNNLLDKYISGLTLAIQRTGATLRLIGNALTGQFASGLVEIREEFKNIEGGANNAAQGFNNFKTSIDAVAYAANKMKSSLEAAIRKPMKPMTTIAGPTQIAGQADSNTFTLPVSIEQMTRQAQEEAAQAKLAFGEMAYELGQEFSNGLKSGITSGIEGLASLLGESLTTGFKDFGKGLLQVIASFAKQIGSLIMAMGIAALPIAKGALLTPQGAVAAIAGGAALIALGSALGAAVSAGPGKSGGSSYGGGYSGSSGGGVMGSIKLQAVVRGQDIWLSNSRYQNSINRNT